MTSHQHSHHDHGHDHGDSDSVAMIELLDLDAEVLQAYHRDVVEWVHELAADRARRRILDLGSGTGAGALALARRFEQAEVIAVDVSAPLQQRLRDKARDAGLADRIRTVEADLDAQWPAVGPVDLVWASNSLHHTADPDRVLAHVFAALPPGGLLAVVEMHGFPCFLPDDIGLGRPGLETRCRAALAGELADRLPHLGSDWAGRLTKAGFTIDAERAFDIHLTPPLPAGAARYAEASLRRARSALVDRIGADDLATLDTLLDSDGPDGLRQRGDLTVTAVRPAWVARRP